MATADIALLTDHRYTAQKASPGDWYMGNILHDDRLLQDALSAIGLTSVRIDWADPDVDWSRFRCAVFRTTWDYYERVSEFTNWLDRIEKQTRLCNDISLIRWNLDKHYLTDLATKEIPVVNSRFIESGSSITLHQLLDETGWEEAVLKPSVSGGAYHTFRVNRGNADMLQPTVHPLIADKSFLMQPFMDEIQLTGEDTLMIIDGRYTHAVRKVATAGDFRVQDDHGGTVHAYEPTHQQIDLAERAMVACPSPPAYGRVDMVRDQNGDWVVMELEIIEPELWLRHHPPAASYFAQAIAREVL